MLDGIDFDSPDGCKHMMQELKRKACRVIKTNPNAQVYPILKEMIAHRPFTPGSHKNVL
jgi:hypothetical protein